MPFLSVSYYNFRNLTDSTIDLLSKEVYFVGLNGQGKSNLLESLYYCAYGNSFRTRNDLDIVKKGQKDFSIRALYQEESGTTKTISVFYENSKKRIEKNGKVIHDRKELINTMPCILFCHDDLEFVSGEPVRRRFFLDQSLSMYDVYYIDILRKYKQILKNRNLILKEQNYEMLETYDIQLIQNGLEIQKKRKDLVFQFNQLFSKLYEEVTGITNVTLAYEPSWKEVSEEVGSHFPTFEEVQNVLLSKRDQDKIMCTTMSGPHRDRIRYIKDGKSFISIASTGQQRLIALLLRVAQAIFYTRVTNKKPVLLMDDVLLELDPDKRQKLTSLLPEYDQLFCTFLPGEPYERYKRSKTKVFFIEEGAWHE